jgi:hypothetical protein
VPPGAGFASIQRNLSMPAGSPPSGYYLLISYAARGAANLPVFVDPVKGPVGFLGNSLGLAGGPGTNILYLGPWAPRRVEVELNPGNTLCVKRMDVVTLNAVR